MIVTFETAKMAKSLGFDYMCHAGYTPAGILSITFYIKNYPDEDWYAAPTQSDLQKWLREKHNIHIGIIWFKNDDNIEWTYCLEKIGEFINSIPIKIQDYNEYNSFLSYELALEQGLQQALKHIIDEKDLDI